MMCGKGHFLTICNSYEIKIPAKWDRMDVKLAALQNQA